jgi:hypothetical protein
LARERARGDAASRGDLLAGALRLHGGNELLAHSWRASRVDLAYFPSIVGDQHKGESERTRGVTCVRDN